MVGPSEPMPAMRDSVPVLGGVQAPRVARPLRAYGLDPACAPGSEHLSPAVSGGSHRRLLFSSRNLTSANIVEIALSQVGSLHQILGSKTASTTVFPDQSLYERADGLLCLEEVVRIQLTVPLIGPHPCSPSLLQDGPTHDPQSVGSVGAPEVGDCLRIVQQGAVGGSAAQAIMNDVENRPLSLSSLPRLGPPNLRFPYDATHHFLE